MIGNGIAELDLRVALYSGIFVHHDAVSNSLRSKIEVIQDLNTRGAAIDFTVFTHASDYRAPYIRGVLSVADLLREERFRSADVHIFEFGMSYDLFDSVFVIPRDRPIMVVEHNTTPPELVDDVAVKLGCEAALVQRHNLSKAHRIACASEFNVDLDLSVGMEKERLVVLHPPPGHRIPSGMRTGFAGHEGPVRLLYLGRFVRAKGVGDLLKAVSRLWAEGDDSFVLTLAGNPQFSDESVLAELQRCSERFGRTGKIETVSKPSDEEIVSLLQESDVLVIPSYHEGYCVPVIEAMAAGCYVIGYDAGNLPNVIGGLGTMVPTGDIESLEAVIDDVVTRLAGRDGCRVAAGSDSSAATDGVRVPTAFGDLDYTSWADAVARHLVDYSEDAYERGFLALIEEMAKESPAGITPRLGKIISERALELAPT